MSKRISYTDEPIKIGRRLGREILPTHGGVRQGAGRPASGNQSVTLRLPTKLVALIRRDAKRAGQSLSEFVAGRLADDGGRRGASQSSPQAHGDIDRRPGMFRGQIRGDVLGSLSKPRDGKLKGTLGSGPPEVSIPRSGRRKK